MVAGVCRRCGCTDCSPCLLNDAGDLVDVEFGPLGSIEIAAGLNPCTWIEADLCSGCVEQPPPPPLLVDMHGRPLRGAP